MRRTKLILGVALAGIMFIGYGGICGIGSDKTTISGSSGLLPASPSNLAATAVSSSEVSLSWQDNSQNEDGFKIERSANQITFTEIASVSANIANYSDTTLIDGTTYYYRVKAFNTRGDSAYSNTASVTLPLAAPSSLGVTPDSAWAIKLTWVDNSSSEDGFIIERKTGVGGTYANVGAVLANITAYTDTGLSPLTTYYYRVKAYNGDGMSSYSNEPNATTQAPPPPIQAASPAPSDGATNVSINTQLSWAAAAYATSYDIYFGTTTEFVIPAQAGIQTTSYNPGALNFSTTYYWRIDAKNSAGTTQGAVWSFTTKAPTPPAQVTTPTPSDGATNIPIAAQLSWASAADATSYDVYFGTTTTGWTPVNNTVPASYTPSSLLYEIQYYWRIDAKNSVGVTTGIIWSFTTQPGTAPSAATGVYAAPGNTQVILSWNNVSDTTSYNIYWSTNSGVTKTTSTKNQQCHQPIYPYRPDQRHRLLLCDNRRKQLR